jgi:hypothetical protein
MHAQKLVAGALLAGMTIVTGEATLIATAGGVGVNWLAEGVAGGLAGLRPARGAAAGPLATAYAAAIRQAAAQLQADYTRTVDPRSDAAAFALVAACAQEVAAAEFPAAAAAVDTAQAVLAQALDALLLGHDPRQVDYLRGRLLPVCAAAFQQQLVADAGAWRAFHGLLLQALAANVLTLGPKLERFDAVLAAFSDPTAALHALRQGTARLEASAARIETTTAATQDAVARLAAQVDDLAERPPAGGATFHNQGMTVHGGLYQAERQYFGSAHAAEGGTALVVNNLGTPPTPPASAPPLTILVLAANPLDTARVRLDAEVRAIDGALRQGEAAMRWTLRQQWAVRSGDLVDALLRFRPTVVHFAGHGAADGSLLVEDLAGMSASPAPRGHRRAPCRRARRAGGRAQRLLVGCAGRGAAGACGLRGGHDRGSDRRRSRRLCRGFPPWPGRRRSSGDGRGAGPRPGDAGDGQPGAGPAGAAPRARRRGRRGYNSSWGHGGDAEGFNPRLTSKVR